MVYGYSVYIGMNDKDAHKQEIKTENFKNIIGKAFENCTILDTTGFFRGEKEKSLQVTVYDIDLKTLTMKINELKNTLNQESIGYAPLTTKATFI